LFPGSVEVERPFHTSYVEYAERVPQQLGPARITAYPVIHTPGTNPHGLRVEYGGKVIAYSGDTQWTDTLRELARGADVFICECNFFEPKGSLHLAYETLIEKRSQLECGRIVITHMGEDVLARLTEIEFEAAADGAVFEV
jgi:ribonuclease BN (tRNA processing enzyme)